MMTASTAKSNTIISMFMIMFEPMNFFASPCEESSTPAFSRFNETSAAYYFFSADVCPPKVGTKTVS